jgi:hypothetical protein
MGKNKKGSGSNQKASSKNSQKKNANQVFKVATSGGNKKSQKKTKEIPKKLKQLDLKTKDKADHQLKNLHLKMVSKKDVKQSQPVGKKKQPAPSTEKVQDGLNKMIVK